MVLEGMEFKFKNKLRSRGITVVNGRGERERLKYKLDTSIHFRIRRRYFESFLGSDFAGLSF